MGEAAISATIEVVLGTVISVTSNRIGLVRGFDKELQSLSNYARSIQCFLADADGKMLSPPVKDWIMHLEDEAFKAENVLDELRYENLRRQVKYRNQFKKKVCFFFSLCNTFGFRSRLASWIRDINTNFRRINGNANELGLVAKLLTDTELPDTATTSRRRETDSVRIPNAVGRAEDEAKIVKMLLSPSSERPLSLYPIIGIGGLGKTTLAKSVYNNPDIERHFNKKTIWVCVAKTIEIPDLFKLILESLTEKKVELDTRAAIVKQIGEVLGGERYFLVLDDVWNCEPVFWEDFLNTLEGINRTNGSWCLVTTRLLPMEETMCRHLKMGFDQSPKLRKLDEDECWSIVKVKVVAGEEVPKELEAIKGKILRRCDGLPLAATLIGGLLLCKEKEEWGSIVDKSLLDGDQNDTKQIVKVSFDHLSPASVKKCFAYCSIFPQDTEMDKDQLIELWMAEGFLPQDGQNGRMMEEIGDTCFRILLQSSLLEDAGWFGRRYYKMHDIVHNFAESVLNPDRKRYLALNSYEEMPGDIEKNISPSIRTLFLKSEIASDMLLKLEYLHVLKLFGENVKELPDSIGALKHLQFLDISDSGIKILPKSLCKLYSLQTLRINVANLNGLPKRLSNLISLRYLHTKEYPNTFPNFEMPSGMGRLTCLVTLEFFNVGQEKGRRIEEIGNLKHLKGSLQIGNLERVNGKEGAQLAKLFEKPNLSRLDFGWGRDWDREAGTYNGDDDVLEGLQPHPNLKQLNIIRFMGNQLPQWFLNLSALGDLELRNCTRLTQLPALGKLPSLRSLWCSGLENIRCIGLSFYGIDKGGSRSTVSGRVFPALEYLSLSNMENFVEWKDVEEKEVDFFPMLKQLEIHNCKRLTQLPALGKLPSLRSLWCSGLENIRCIGLSFYGIDEGGSRSTVSGRVFPALEELSLIHMENLVEWKDVEEEVDLFPMLRILEINNCSQLTTAPSIHRFQALRNLEIRRCPGINMLLIPKGGQKSLLGSLEDLDFSDCDGLINGVLAEMLESCASSLRMLRVYGCPNLVSIPLGSLTRLELLFIDYSLFEFNVSSSAPLDSLALYGSPRVESQPAGLQFHTTLTWLKFSDFGLEALPDWIGNLASLNDLVLDNCQKLQYLPSIATMRGLTKLERLSVHNCPLLKERCSSSSGTDSEWVKISHIPQLHIS